MAELENPATGPVTARGFTPLHDLVAALVDQMTALRVLTEAYIKSQVTIDGEIAKRFVTRPDSAIDLAKELKITRERDALDGWYERLMKEANSGGL